MLKELENTFIDIEVVNAETNQRLSLCIASAKTVGRVLEVAAGRLQMLRAGATLDSLRLRREGGLLPLDCDAPAGEILRPGDRLVVERAGGQAAGHEREAVEADDPFLSAAGRIAAGAVSADSAKFLSRARQPIGE
jgi:hypothetical protein